VQLDTNKPTLKAPGTKRLKLKCDDLLSDFAFKCNLRRYIMASLRNAATSSAERVVTIKVGRF